MVNFQSLPKVEPPQKYFDMAVKAAKQKANVSRGRVSRAVAAKKAVYIETQHIDVMNKVLQKHLDRILKEFPRLEQLSVFYRSLCDLRFSAREYHQKLGQLNWSLGKIHQLAGVTINRIQRSRTIKEAVDARQSYYGRVASILERLKETLHFLEQCRKNLKAFPDIKSGMYTICICGFPNVGKSTLLKKLTGANPEIANYAFTTKSLNTGYLKQGSAEVQLIDTPGALNREKMNKIEQEADLAIRYCADLLVYVADPTEEYPLAQQEALLEYLRTVGKPILVYLSKTDIADKRLIDQFSERFKKKPIRLYSDLPSDSLKGELYLRQWSHGKRTKA